MICVCIGRSQHAEMIADHHAVVSQGAQLVELRLDYLAEPNDFRRVLSERAGPAIVTCRRQEDGGKWCGSENDRLDLIRSVLEEGVEFVDLEIDVADSIPRVGATKRIVSYHDFAGTPEDIEQLHAKMVSLDADIVKLATKANSTHDNCRMLRLIRQSSVPTVGLCMGDIGSPTRVLSTKFGAPFTFASLSESERVAPGQFTYREMVALFDADNIQHSTPVYGVIADPVGHSLSPQIHNASLRHLGIESVYLPIRVPPQDLSTFIQDCVEMGVSGLSVTIPHKETVLPLCTQPDEQVRGIGATNTLVFRDGEIFAHNTDCSAALGSLEESLGIEQTSSDCLEGKTALLLGGGGVAKAIAFGLRQRGAKVVVAARTPSKVASLRETLGCEIVSWDQRHSVDAEILMNCSPIGMSPNVNATPYESNYLRSNMVVFDTIYNPEETQLILDARAAKCSVVTGLEMFVRQAAIQFKLFTGKEAPADVMRRVLKESLEEGV